MPSRAFGDAHAVTRTTESPIRTMTDPSACFAYLPVSNEREVPLISSSRLYICASEVRVSIWPYPGLLADAQAPDQLGIPLGIFALQIVEQASALADELEE